VDIDYGKIKLYVGNYDFWYESSQLIQQLIRNKNKRNEEKIAELQTFVSRFAANKVQEQAGHLPPQTAGQNLRGGNSRSFPPLSLRWVHSGSAKLARTFCLLRTSQRPWTVSSCWTRFHFIVNRNEKIAFVGENELAQTTMFRC
jgi:ATPase subunit of ABC transporter with duplicated ATPase domains